MEKYLIRKPRIQDSTPVQDSIPMQDTSSSSKRICFDFNLENLRLDMNLRVFWLLLVSIYEFLFLLNCVIYTS